MYFRTRVQIPAPPLINYARWGPFSFPTSLRARAAASRRCLPALACGRRRLLLLRFARGVLTQSVGWPRRSRGATQEPAVGPLVVPHLAARSGRRVAAVPSSPRLRPQALTAPSLRSGRPHTVSRLASPKPRRYPGTGGGAPLSFPTSLRARAAASRRCLPALACGRRRLLLLRFARVPLTSSVGGPRRSRGATQEPAVGPLVVPHLAARSGRRVARACLPAACGRRRLLLLRFARVALTQSVGGPRRSRGATQEPAVGPLVVPHLAARSGRRVAAVPLQPSLAAAGAYCSFASLGSPSRRQSAGLVEAAALPRNRRWGPLSFPTSLRARAAASRWCLQPSLAAAGAYCSFASLGSPSRRQSAGLAEAAPLPRKRACLADAVKLRRRVTNRAA